LGYLVRYVIDTRRATVHTDAMSSMSEARRDDAYNALRQSVDGYTPNTRDAQEVADWCHAAAGLRDQQLIDRAYQLIPATIEHVRGAGVHPAYESGVAAPAAGMRALVDALVALDAARP
jgi:hypothetical protein